MGTKPKYKNRINERRVRNINSLKELALFDFKEYAAIHYPELSEKKQMTKFKKFFVLWIDDKLSYDSWRMIETYRRSVTNDFIIKLEDKFHFDKGLLDTENEKTFNKRLFYFKCIYFVKTFIKEHNLEISNKETSKIISNLYLDNIENSHLSSVSLQYLLE